MNINYSLFTLLIPLLVQISPCSGTAKLMVRFDSFDNPGFLKENGECCDGERRNGICTGNCDYSVRVCLSRNASGDPCELESFDVGSVAVVTSSFTFPRTFDSGFANPVPISLNSWQGDVIVTVNIYDEDTEREERVDSFNLTYTRFTPVSNRALLSDDFLPYTLIGRRQQEPTTLQIAVTAACDRYFYGDECLVNCVENDDCNGHYTCEPVTGAKICNEGWTGDNCSISASPDHGCLTSQVCENNAECIKYGNRPTEYYCCCAPGFTGTLCDQDIDECASNPCQNGASCLQERPNSYTCVCPIRFKGEKCEIQRNCDDDPCENGGECRSVVGSFFCLCDNSYTGETCETLITTTQPTTTPACPPDFYGPDCSVFCQAQDDCTGHYTCDSVSGNKLCNPTWGGVNCSISTFDDPNCQCVNGGQCFEGQCCCPEQFTGSRCETRLFCRDDSCSNGGQCYEESNGFRCACREGFIGRNCENAVRTCPDNFYGPLCAVFCRSQEDCTGGQWSCDPMTGQRQCRFGWRGPSCSERDPSAIHRTPCPDSQCRNGGVCANSTCCCPIGYTGSLCHVEILECSSNPCQNNARCEDLIGDYQCFCPPEFTGKNCEYYLGLEGRTTTQAPDLCVNVNCLNGGTCIGNSSTTAICLCLDRFTGDRCQTSARATTPGQNQCPPNFYGPTCQTFCIEEDSCERGHFYCDAATGRRLCRNGWIGDICNTRAVLPIYDPECPSMGCKNRGQCFNGSCCCLPNTQGKFCQEDLLPCDAQPCQNGGQCQDLVSGYSCECPSGFTGRNCESVFITTPATTSTTTGDLEACQQERCQNGGVCIPTLLPFSCYCLNASFAGQYCEINIASTPSSSYRKTIYFLGNISDNNQGAIQQILQRAETATASSSSCCLIVNIVEKRNYIDQAGNAVVGYVYTVTHSTDGNITPGPIPDLYREVNSDLQNTAPFDRDGVFVYTGLMQQLANLDLVYSVDIIGTLPESRRQSVIQDIETAWRTANPNCGCQFSVNIASSQEYAGEYGMTVSRVFYTIKRDNEPLEPASTQAPSRGVFVNLARSGGANSVYQGTFLLPYNQHHELLLNRLVDVNSEEWSNIREAIRLAWTQWKNTNPSVPENIRNTIVDVVMLRPKVFYTQEGIRLTKLMYFVVLNNTIIIGPQPGGVTVSSPLVCEGCTAIPLPYVDIKGPATRQQIINLGANLNPSDPSGSSVETEQFVNSNGEPVIRVYYQPPISEPDVTSTAVSQQRLDLILNMLGLEQPTLPTERTYAVTFAGSITESDKDVIEELLTNAWVNTYGIPAERIRINITSDGTFTSSTGTGQLTQIRYSVSVQGGDSQWTRFGGLDLETLRQYFITPDLVVVGGAGTLAPLQTTTAFTSSAVSSVTTATPTGVTSTVETISVVGNITDANQGLLEEVLQTALNRSRTGSPCCVTLYIVEKTYYAGPSGEVITGLRYNITGTDGASVTLTDSQRQNFTAEIQNGLQTVDVFRQGGVVIYTGAVSTPTYSVDFVGDLPDSRRPAVLAFLEAAWNRAYPGCNCRFVPTILTTQEYSGEYGIKITRISYTMTRDGQLQNPDTVPPPSRGVFITSAQGDVLVNSVYSGSILYPANQRHSALLTGVVDVQGSEGQFVRDAIKQAWEQFRQDSQALPPGLQNAPLEIILLRPQPYYTSDGKELTNVEYLVVLNGRVILGPQVANVSLTNPLFCTGCTAVPVPFVDIQGTLASEQLAVLGRNLNPSDPDGKTVSSESFTNANGDHITRIYYRPPFTDPTSQTTALSEESLQNILTRLNLQRPTLLTEKTFTLNFDGKLNDNNIDVIENTITDAWASTYNIPQNAISVKVNSINNNFISQSSNTPATEVTYTVSVLGADSQWTSFNDIRPSTIGRFFTNTGLVTITGEVITTNPGETTTTLPTSSTTEPFLIDTIFIRGNISNTLQSQVEEILRSSLNKSTEGVPCCYTLRILDKVTFLDQNGNVVEGYRYNVSNTTGSPVTSFSQLQTLLFETEVQNELRSSGVFTQLGSVLYVGEVDTLTPITFTYTVDFIGDIPYTWRDAIIADIETAWQTANQDCNCEFSGNIVYILKFTGDYGLTVSRVFYSMTRDGRTQNPVQTQAPAWDIVAGLVRGDNRVNPLYSGSVLLSDRLAHSVLLNNVVDMQSTLGNDITNAIEAAWINWRDTNQAVPPSLRRGTLDIVLKRPQMYYTPDGRQLTYLEYFVLLNGTSIIGPEGTNVPLNGQYFCDGCTAVPVPYVEVQGSLSPEQLQTLISNLNPTSRTTTPVISERFVNTLGDDITRVYYQPPISTTDGQPTLLSPQRIAQTLTNLGLQEASLPKQKTFTINLAGNDQANNANRVQQVLRASWASSLNIPLDDLTVTVVSMDDDFVSSSGPVTRVNYRVTIQNGDSHWTRYAGIPLESLQQYLQASSLVVVTGVIQPSGGSTPGSMTGTTVTATTPSVVSGPTDASPTTPTTGSTNTIYIIDNSGAQNETVVEEVLQTALNRTRTGSTCCLTVHVIEWTQYVDNKTSDTIIGYTYNVTNGTQPVTLTPGEVTNIQNEVTKVVVTDPFINFGYVLYTGTVTGLKNVSFTYSVDLVGDVPEWQRQNVIREIQRVWQEANPDCQCVYTVSIEHIADYSGDYGSPVSRVYYTVKRDDQYQDPAVDPAPSRSQFRSTLQEGNSLRALYRGSVLYPYNKRHSILLNSVISLDSDQGIRIQNNVRDAWINWRNTDPSVPNDKRNAPIEIIFLKPETFYTQDGRTLTSFEYLVLLDNTELIGPERANISLTGPDFCQNCVAVVVPYVDIDGTPTTEQLQGLGFNLNPTDPSGTTLSSEVFMDPNNAQVTRVFYRPPISGPDVQSTAISEPRLTQILSTFNLKQSIQPVKKTYTLDFAGSVGDNFKTSVEQTIRDVWSDEYGLAPELISVDINKIDDNFISTPSNNKVTKMEYTVSVNGIDSHWTRFEGVDIDTLTPYFTQRELTLVTGEVITIGEVTPPTTPPVMTQVIYIRGNDSTNTADRVEEILQTAVNNTKNGSTCCFTVHVIEWTSYIDSNTGDNVVGYTYNVTNGTEPVILTPDEVTNIQNEVTNVVVTDPFINFGYVLYTGSVTDLKNVSFTYSVDLVGDVPEWERQNVIREIQRVWQEANPDCQCVYMVSIEHIADYNGDYGSPVSRVYYTVKRDDQYQDPAVDPAPSRSQFSSTLQEGDSTRALYPGTVLYPYNKRHSILLNSITSLDSDQGNRIQNNIRGAWINWRNTDPSVQDDKRNAPIEIIFLKPETYYTPDGRSLTSFEYLVLLDNTELIGPERANISLTGPDFCQNCVAVVVPYVDIDGALTPEQLQGLGFNLNPTDPSGTTLSSEVFVDPNNTQVTRVFYRPPISGPDVQSTAINEPRLTQILSTYNLNQTTKPIKKTYTLDFAGTVGDNFKTSVEQTIRDVWSDEYGLSPELISVDVNEIDDNFISTPSNNKVTKMEYTVSVNGIDSHWTRFEGVDIDTLTPYFTQRELTLVTGEVITIGEVTPPTTPPVMTQVIYIRGNDSTNTADRVEEILQTAVNNTKNGSTCCFTVHVIEWTSYIDSNTGDNVVGYTYNVTNGTEPVILTPDEVTNVQNEVTKVVVTDPFINLGYVLYTGTVTDLKNVSFTYSVDLVGDVPEWQRPNVIREIQRVWQEANPGCQCTYTVSIRFIEGFIGDYGTQVSRIYYTVKRDDQYQDPATDQAPSRSQFSSTLQEGNSPRALYRGSVLYPYNKRHSILLNSVTSLDSDQGIRIQNNIRDAWINWRNTDPSVPDALRSASIDIINLRPQTYYTPDGRTMTSFEYLVLLDDTELIGPQRANISLTGPDFCQNCVAVVIPYVDIDGTLTPEQREGFGYIVNPLDPTGSTLSSEVFINGDSSRVTRVYYQPPITSPDVQSTEFSEPRLSNILRTFNLTQPSDPMEKLYTIYLSGTIGDNARDNIELTILNAWSELYGVPVADLSVNISDINDKFVITPSNDPVTRVRYTVAVEEVDSHLTRFEGADTATLSPYFTDSTLTLIQGQIIDKEETTPPFQGLPFFSEVIYIRGNVSESDKGMVEEILQKALNTTKYGASCCITVDVYSNSPYIDQNGNIVVGYQFNVSNSTGGPVTSLTPQENRTFTAEVNKELQTSDLFTRYGSVIYTGPFTDLKYIDFAYTVELIGDIPDQQRRALIADIEQAWKTANPDCQCLYKANIITMPKYSGEYGILLHRVYYTITRDGRIQDPATTPAPAHGVFKTTMEGSVNAVYSGAYLLPYNLRQSVKLIGDIDLYSTQGQQVQRAVMNAWINWRNVHHEVPEMLRTGTMEIQYLRPIRYYTENQQIVTQLDYFLILNGSVIAPTHVPVINSQYVCDECEAIPVPFADVKGQLTTNKLQELNARLGGIGGSAAAVYVEEFVDSKEEPVSRVYYQSTALPPEQLTAILTAQGLQQPTPPTSRAFYVYFEGSVSSDQNAIIEETIKNNWSGTYSIPQSVLQVDVINIDDRYVSSTNNQQVTRATYTVTIQGADSVWTKFKGLEPGTLAQVFREVPGLVVVTGNVIYTDFISTTPGTASPTFPSETSSTIQTLYFRGNISDSNAGSVQAILQGAFNDTVNGASCCVMVYLIEKTTYIDNAGSVLVGYSYNLTNITGGPVEAMAPEQTDVFRKDVNSRLQSTEPFRQTGVVLYTGSLQGFRVADLAYYVDFVGDMPPRPTTKSLIDQVWRNANQDCGCELSAEILLTVPMSGDYGIKVYRVYYTMKRDGQVQSPSVVNPPERSAFATATVSDKSLNPLYMGSTLIPYNQRHSVLLNRVVDITGSQGTDVQQALLAAWISWLNNNPNFPEGISTADIDILLLRPVTYYTQAGTQNSMVDYFVVVRGQLIGPGQGPTLTGPLFCKCSALPVPFVDVKGTLHWSQLLQLGTALNPEDTTGTSLNREMFIDANGEPVTRVFYAPTITGSDVTTTAVEPDKLNVILSTQNLERPDILIQKTFTFNFAGSLGEEYKEAITEGIVNAWSGSFVIPQEDITVDIVNIDTNYYSNDGGGKVTQVTYTVSILEADSSWSRFEGMNTEDLDQFFQTESPDVKVCGCSARPGREILVVGTVGNDTSELAAALVTAWNEANPAFTGTLAVGIQQVEGSTPSTLKYTVIPENGPTAFVDGDLTPPSDEMLNSKFSPLDLTVYKAENDDDSSTLAWAIPLGIILALLLLLLIILIIFCCIRSRRRKHVETIEHDAAKFQERGYDKEHFTTQPVYFENEAYGESHGFYAVNGDETVRGGILNGKSAGHSKKENIKMVNYQESKDEMSVKSAALLDAGNDLLLPISATSSRSFTLNVDGGATAASASTEDCERKIREAWSNVYGPMAGDLKVQMDTMEAASSSMGYTISGNGESCEEIIQTADHSKIEAYLASTGFIRNERETTLNTDSTANKGHYSSEISFNVPATTSTTSTLQSGSTIIEAEVLPKNQHANHSESFESGITFTVPATSASSAASSVTTGGAQTLEDTVYFRGSISDNYQPLVESLLQSSWNKATDDFSSYKVKVEDKTEHTDRFGEPVNGYRYSVKKSGGGQVPELSAEQAQTFTNHITIELHNTNVFKQDEVVLYSGSAHDLKLVRASSSDEVIFTSLEPTNGGGSSFEQTSTTVSTIEPTNGEGSSFEQTSTTVSSLEPTRTIVTSLEPNDNKLPSLGETLWVSSGAQDGLEAVSQEMKTESGSFMTEHFVSSSGHTESKTVESFSTSQVQETSFHREQFSTQVFHIQKDVFAESHGLHVVHNEHTDKEHV